MRNKDCNYPKLAMSGMMLNIIIREALFNQGFVNAIVLIYC